jgi:hypothetical protein
MRRETMHIVETVQETETHRVVLVADDSPHEPYNDGGSPILRYWRDRTYGGFHAEQITNITSFEVPDEIVAALQRWGGDDDYFERYCRIFHGSTEFDWYTPNDRDYNYVTFDTAKWREAMGLTDEHVAKYKAKGEPIKLAEMSEWQAYCEGNVYGIVTEKKVTWHAEGHPDRVTWEQEDSIWGFYGYEYALEAARTEYKLNEEQGA